MVNIFSLTNCSVKEGDEMLVKNADFFISDYYPAKNEQVTHTFYGTVLIKILAIYTLTGEEQSMDDHCLVSFIKIMDKSFDDDIRTIITRKQIHDIIEAAQHGDLEFLNC